MMLQPRDCANLAKEYNGENNWCLLRDAHCHLLTKHERYKFDKADLKCDYLDGLNVAVEPLSSKRCKGCNQLFKTSNLRLRFCSEVCRRIARRKSEKESRIRNSL
jgi:hypothetical protein